LRQKYKINKTCFRPVLRQQQDRFRNKLFAHLSCFAAFFVAFFLPFSDFFGPAILARFFQYAVQKTHYFFAYAVQKFVAVFWGRGWW